MQKRKRYEGGGRVYCFARKNRMQIAEGAYADIEISENLVQLLVKDDQIRIKGEKEHEVRCNGKRVEEDSLPVSEGDMVEIPGMEITFFSHRIEVKSETDFVCGLLQVHGAQEPSQGFPLYKRAPRIVYQDIREKIEIVPPPEKKTMGKGSLAQLIIPSLTMLAFTIAMSVFLKRGAYVYMSAGMTLITILFCVQKYLAEKKETKRENQKRREVYEQYLLDTRKKINALRREERKILNYREPTIHELERMVHHYSSRIYERTALEEDFLKVNLGYRKGASLVEVSFGEKKLTTEQDELLDMARELSAQYRVISGIPVTVDLKKAHLGLVGSKKNLHEQLKLILAQLTFFQSYHDLQIILIHSKEYEEEFRYARWYPHLRIKRINVIARISNDQSRDQILGSLQQILKERKTKQEEEKKDSLFLPHLLFIIDEPKMILNHAIMEYLQASGMDLGFSMIYTTNQRESLPENIKSICLVQNAVDGILLLENGLQRNISFQLQSLQEIRLETMARNLSVLLHEQGISSKIPESITFFDLYGIEHPRQLDIKKRWEKNRSHKSLAVPLGLRSGEDVVELNLHEKAHGPHGLVAGTTGSGKSEIVQSYILSLAVNFHPHEVGFLLIDYKGGGMANLFRDLPHLLGTITNLDKAESMRAMASIKSELSRRQRIFGECGVNHINGYNQLFKLGKVKEPLPHLFMISDEFAELKKEQPEFMAELISTARIGRSLGIHLILATQKPSGVVDDQIWTNSKFRLCLKVQNASDSKEMLKTPDAAGIVQAGRAYLQVGNNEIYELFQSAWSGAAYETGQTIEEKEDDRVYLVNTLGQGELLNRDLSGPIKDNQIKETQLDVLVGHMQEVYQQLDAVAVKKTWLPPLKTMIESPYTKEVRDSASFTQGDYTLGLGLMDIPEEQRQEEYVLDLLKNGHLLYMASSGYGKTVLLTSIILGLSLKNSVDLLHVYLLDLGNSALITLRGLPHVADYMGLEDEEKLTKLQKLILEELSERKRLLAGAMAQNISVYNASQKEPLKVILIAIDNYDVIGELGDSMVSFVQKVARDGAGLGIYLLVTMTRDSAMRASTKGSFKERMAGFNFVEGENNAFMGRSALKLTEEKKGRVLVKREGIHMMQVYLPVSGENELLYNERLKEKIQKVAQASTQQKAKGIPTLPQNLYYDMLKAYPAYENHLTKLPVGIEEESLAVRYLDVEKEPGLIIGEGGMGRTNALCNILRHLQGYEGVRLYVFDAKKGDLAFSRTQKGVHYVAFGGAYEEAFSRLEGELAERKQAVERGKEKDPGLPQAAFVKEWPPLFVLIDVVQELAEALEEKRLWDRLELLEELLSYGLYLAATSQANLRASRNRLFQRLSQVRSGLAVGNVRKQNVFAYTGIREENREPGTGYYFGEGKGTRLKLVQHV